MTAKLPKSMTHMVERVADCLPQIPRLPRVFADTFSNTFTTTLKPHEDGSVFVITGDIPAMWLRDSAAQVRPYLQLAKADDQFAELITGVVKRQMKYVLLDPYANAFNDAANGRCHYCDKTEMSAWIWERKYELDSLCAPLLLAHELWKATGQIDHLDETFLKAAQLIVATIALEQRHEKSPYSFERLKGRPSDTLTNDGRGNPVAYTGMSWSGFRPSDDACTYNYLIPSNMMAATVLARLAELPLANDSLKLTTAKLAAEIREGIEVFGKVAYPQLGTIYAYETDGFGNHNLMDDANVPSLLSMPYLGYCAKDDPTYLATRKFVLSDENPFHFRGSAAAGIGSPHTPKDHIWPIALCMQALTSTSRDEKLSLLESLLRTDAGTGLMHESFHKDDPMQFTRPWFAWANSLFAEMVMDVAGLDSLPEPEVLAR
jgi:meiotically up-regulated gene 157 (Mug157) protein